MRVAAAVEMNDGDYERPIAEARRLRALHDDALLRFGRVKAYVDGVIEAHTAAMLEPYADDPAFGLGLPNWTPEALQKAVVAADRAGLQVYLHAIGDRGVRMALDAHEAALRANGRATGAAASSTSRPSRPPTTRASRALGVIASMQPLHANPDQNNYVVWRRTPAPTAPRAASPGATSSGRAPASSSAATGRWSPPTSSAASTARSRARPARALPPAAGSRSWR